MRHHKDHHSDRHLDKKDTKTSSSLNLSNYLRIWRGVLDDHHTLDMTRRRMMVAASFFLISFFAISIRLVDIMVIRSSRGVKKSVGESSFSVSRHNILDRNDYVIATHLITASIYANPHQILDSQEAVSKLVGLFPTLSPETLLMRLRSDKHFSWMVRHIAPKVQEKFYRLGIPGVYIKQDEKRVYPYGFLFSHVLGVCGLDNEGLSGLEKFFEKELKSKNSSDEKGLKGGLKTSLDLRVQHIVRQELLNALQEFRATAANAIVMNAKTGEILSMVSLPDYDANAISKDLPEACFFNRNTLGSYEPGSTAKIFNIAIALESGSATLSSLYDARFPVQIGHFRVSDFRGKNRFLTLREAFVYSSNIASIKIAQQFGKDVQKTFLKHFRILDPVRLEIPEMGGPLIPKHWSDVTMMTVSYGYGFSVTPLQLIATVNALTNGGIWVQPTLLFCGDREVTLKEENRIISEETSQILRDLMRAVATETGGTGRKANASGYSVFVKTGTAYQARGGHYNGAKNRLTTCIAGVSLQDPQLIMLLMLENAQATPSTHGFSTAGWNAAPTVGRIIEKMAPLLGLKPTEDEARSAPDMRLTVTHVKGKQVLHAGQEAENNDNAIMFDKRLEALIND